MDSDTRDLRCLREAEDGHEPDSRCRGGLPNIADHDATGGNTDASTAQISALMLDKRLLQREHRYADLHVDNHLVPRGALGRMPENDYFPKSSTAPPVFKDIVGKGSATSWFSSIPASAAIVLTDTAFMVHLHGAEGLLPREACRVDHVDGRAGLVGKAEGQADMVLRLRDGRLCDVGVARQTEQHHRRVSMLPSRCGDHGQRVVVRDGRGGVDLYVVPLGGPPLVRR